MPNWCCNHVEFASEEDCARTRKLMDRSDVTGEAFDFNAVLPMPAPLEVPAPADEYAIWWYLTDHGAAGGPVLGTVERYIPKAAIELPSEMSDRARERAESWKPFKGAGARCDIEDYFELGRRYVENIDRFGDPTWYDWRCSHWGTKWEPADVTWGKTDVGFDTAWGPVPKVMKAMTEALGIRVYYEFAEEQFDVITGEHVYSSGVLTEWSEPECGSFGAFAIASRVLDPGQESHRWSEEDASIVTVYDDAGGGPERLGACPIADTASAMEAGFLEGHRKARSGAAG